MPKFKIKYNATSGEIKDTVIEKNTLAESIEEINDFESIVYYTTETQSDEQYLGDFGFLRSMKMKWINVDISNFEKIKHLIKHGSSATGKLYSIFGEKTSNVTEGKIAILNHKRRGIGYYLCQNIVDGGSSYDYTKEEKLGYNFVWWLGELKSTTKDLLIEIEDINDEIT